MLTSMGFNEEAAAAALTACQGSVERAGDWLFSHMDDLDAAVAAVKQQAAGGGGGGAAPAAAGGATAGSSSAPK
jgi:ubiquitin carboxyl-terminal hydrolase 5/13